jgi:hypothetical protein
VRRSTGGKLYHYAGGDFRGEELKISPETGENSKPQHREHRENFGGCGELKKEPECEG